MKSLNEIIRSESAGGLLLCAAGLFALFLANSPAHIIYDSLLNSLLVVKIGMLEVSKPLVLWINDGLMATFFLLVGLEIKREVCKGKLQDKAILTLPIVGAMCGLLVPALIYISLNYHDSVALQGWAIPVATDIAFSLAVLSLLGTCVPTSLKIFLTALAIIDDIGAVIIIALFYTKHLSLTSLSLAAVAIFLLYFMNIIGVKRLSPFCFVGFLLWLSLLKSGVHATLSGIILAFAIPLEKAPHQEQSALERLENVLLPWVTLFVLPAFAFANSGFSLTGINREVMTHTATLGIILGLVIGKQVGIFSSCWLLVKLGLGKLPRDVNWYQFYGMSILCGVGFTMSLFIGSLAFQQQAASYSVIVRFGVLVASVTSACLGMCVIYFASKRSDRQD